jgi:hypothetical protein
LGDLVQNTESEPRFFYVDVIWGIPYANMFTNVSLASRLSPLNLPAMPNLPESKTILVTTDEVRAHIMRSSLFKELQKLMDVIFLPLEMTTQSKYDVLATGHRRAIEYIGGKGYGVFFSPDAVVADGSIPRLYELARSGRQIVAGYGPCVNQSAFLAEVGIDPDVDLGKRLSLTPRKFVELLMRHRHINLSCQLVQSDCFPRQPYGCVWDAPNGDGMLVRVWCMHPYLFDTRLVTSSVDLFNATLDWWIIPRTLHHPNSYYVVTDSDEFCICGLQPESAADPMIPNKFDATQIALYLTSVECPYLNRNNFLYGAKFHTGDLDGAWATLERDSQKLALDIIDPARSLKPFIMDGHSGRIAPSE